MRESVLVTEDGEIPIPKELREKYNLTPPCRVALEEAEDGIVIKRVPDPHEHSGFAKGKTNEQGEDVLEILERGREADERFL